MKSRTGGPKKYKSVATRKNRAPREMTEPRMKTGNDSPANPDAMVKTL